MLTKNKKASLPLVMLVMVATARADIELADTPLFLTGSADPNVMFILDDSGSMQQEVLTGENFPAGRFVYPWELAVYNASSNSSHPNWVPSFADDEVYNAYTRSATTNRLYYDPAVTYLPWINADGTLMLDASPAAAYHNPMKPSKGTRNLTVENTQRARWATCSVSKPGNVDNCSRTGDEERSFWPAVYFRHTGGESYSNWSDYAKVEIRSGRSYSGEGREARSDCVDGTCSYEQEIQNFANWYTYYRSRILAARAGIGKAFSTQGGNLRLGFGALNQDNNDIDGVSTRTIISGVRSFLGSDRQAFFDQLYGHDIPYSDTPLRRALKDAGEYYSRSDGKGPWSDTPGTASSEDQLSCRGSYTILMTDGYWTGSSPGVGNVDGSSGPVITGPDGQSFQYIPAEPFKDTVGDTLADVAMHYWNRDLNSSLANQVPVDAQNPAFWQHMVTYGVGLGVQGSIDADTVRKAMQTGNTIDWPNPSDSDSAKIDDLLHAGVNGRGGFFSAADPDTFAVELKDILESIVARTETSASAATLSSGRLKTDTLLYSVGFRSTDWSGSLQGWQLDETGNPSILAWDAETQLAARSSSDRSIFTRAQGSGVSLDFANLSDVQKEALNHDADNTKDNLGGERLNWLRGDDAAHGSFRSRQVSGQKHLLGDVVNADAQLLDKRDYGYTSLPGAEGENYRSFRETSAYQGRARTLFLAANDGMLHAFDAGQESDGGKELFAYLSGELLEAEPGRDHAPLSRLMEPNYDHRYFLDGTPTLGDAYLDLDSGGAKWRSVLVGTMGAGGRSVFALDVSDPKNFTADDVLWEFRDADLGAGVTRAKIARLANGTWAAIFGNGYNSTSQQATLFVVDLATGSLIAKIPTGVGSAASPNGLASPAVTDWPQLDLNTHYVYAGDLLGNLWRFDLSGDVSQWTDASRRKLLFSAKDGNGDPQPITVAPRLAPKPKSPGSLMVLFGTGSYFRGQDAENAQVQSLYGIEDRSEALGDASWIVTRTGLREQTIQDQQTVTRNEIDYRLRASSSGQLGSNQYGWYMDLEYNGQALGERVIASATFPRGASPERVRFSTLIPDSDPCGSGREGFVMDLLVASGSAFEAPVFDLNRDGSFDVNDKLDGEIVSGVGFGNGEGVATLSQEGGELENLYSGDLQNAPGGKPLQARGGQAEFGRQSWLQIR
ncbi:pilus assembly protein [Pistricoccus aurantiacus]|uniref:pilus assembly protein n=1 Tax=Pistricoccus aurantiacus TaxID=1883414 RepID=UPI003638A23F